jgi:hypothetical protein
MRSALTPGLWSKQLQLGVARQCAAQSDAFDHWSTKLHPELPPPSQLVPEPVFELTHWPQLPLTGDSSQLQ